jgi:2',3'-cyclic-nucleotide 2'-phosphodiesterase (5'-nucleotidase family)
LALCFSNSLVAKPFQNEKHDKSSITIIQVSDLHGNMVPHAGVIETPDGEYVVTQGGGIAKVATIVKQIREDNPDSLTLAVGDTIHGQAEVLFTFGDAIMPAVNALGIDAYTPGNWEFGYGPAVFRKRFTECVVAPPMGKFAPCPPIPANARVMTDSDGQPEVVKAEFDTIAMNLYNGTPLPAGLRGKRPLPAYKIMEVDGHRVGIIGITAAIVPQQSPVFSLTFDFTQGTKELPGIIDEVKAAGAELIVVQSELGLPQNVQIGREFPEVDIILSAHSHEVTLGAIIADAKGYEMTTPGERPTPGQLRRVHKGAAIVVEAGEDLYVGRLDLKLNRRGKIKDFSWQAIPVDDDVEEDETVAGLVWEQEKYFVAGSDFKIHTFMPIGFCPANNCGDVRTRGHQLVDPLNTVVGETDVLLHRHEALEGVMNNFLADAIWETLDQVVGSTGVNGWTGIDIAMTNGFRFDTPVLPASMVPAGANFYDGREPGDITLRDLYAYFPIGPAVAAADFNGTLISDSLEGVLSSVFNRNPYLQKGGWYVGLSANVTQKIDLVNSPLSSSGKRIVDFQIDGHGIDPSKRYVFGSCYGHTFPVGRICRTDGGNNVTFFQLADVDDYNSDITTTGPVNSTGIIDKVNGGPILQVAPDRYIHPVQMMRRYLDTLPGKLITEAQFGVGRVVHVDATTPGLDPAPLPGSGLPYIVQPVDGIGPDYMARTVQVVKDHDRHDDDD